MNVIQLFWFNLLEVIYSPIQMFFEVNEPIAVIIVVLFISMQLWCFWHFFFKPFIYINKLFIDIIRRNLLFKEVEVDEKTVKRCN